MLSRVTSIPGEKSGEKFLAGVGFPLLSSSFSCSGASRGGEKFHDLSHRKNGTEYLLFAKPLESQEKSQAGCKGSHKAAKKKAQNDKSNIEQAI